MRADLGRLEAVVHLTARHEQVVREAGWAAWRSTARRSPTFGGVGAAPPAPLGVSQGADRASRHKRTAWPSPWGGKLEGISYAPIHTGQGNLVQVHVLELNNEAHSPDEMYLWQFSLPDPEAL